jgi:hypothetical protein
VRAGAAIVLIVAILPAGCGAGGAARDGAPDAVEASRDHGLPPGHPCTPGQDQTCNDDPAMSALAGRCQNNGECLCNGTFSYDWNTGRCRAGTACAASAGDPWPDEVTLAVDDCATRPAAACAPAASADQAVFNALADVVKRECNFPNYTYLRVELTGGCATLLEVSPEPSSAAQLLPCLERVLSSARWDCAPPTACVLYEYGETL